MQFHLFFWIPIILQLERKDLIILDDFGMQAIDAHNRITLL